MLPSTLRTKFLLALALITTLLTAAMLLTVRSRIQLRVREQLAQDLDGSINTFRALQTQREQTLERSAALLASLPPLMAVMTSQDMKTIQDASATFAAMSGGQLFGLADPSGRWMALHTGYANFGRDALQPSLMRSIGAGRSRDWWFYSGRLFQIFLQPVYFGARPFGARPGTPQLGVLVIGFEVDQQVANDVAHAAACQVLFRYDGQLAASTLPPAQAASWDTHVNAANELNVGGEAFLAKSVELASPGPPRVTLTVLKSFDQATQFLASLNRWILGVGIAGVLAGGVLVFLVSTSFTRPLAELVNGVHALESGDFAYPLQTRGRDEVSALTAAFDRMRGRMLASQQQLLATERLATIGRLATSISHDLRHPLTAILAYAEFLSESPTDSQRKDYYQEIRIAVNRMTEELNSLLGFSKQAGQIRPVDGRLNEVIERAIQSVHVLPEFEKIRITYAPAGEGRGYFDVGKIERVILNLLFNACEAVDPFSGQIEVRSTTTGDLLEVRVLDNGPGMPLEVMANLFQPFVSHGKEQGIGLGLTVVHKIVEDHSGTVTVEHTDASGTEFLLRWPSTLPARDE